MAIAFDASTTAANGDEFTSPYVSIPVEEEVVTLTVPFRRVAGSASMMGFYDRASRDNGTA